MPRFSLILIFLSFVVMVGAISYIVNPVKILKLKNDTTRIQDTKKIKGALEAFYKDYGEYPHYDKDTYQILSVEREKVVWGSTFSPYLNLLPKDPDPNRTYVYWSDNENGNKSYKIYASLDYPSLVKSSCGVHECPNVPEKNLCGHNKICNYAVTSGNISP